MPDVTSISDRFSGPDRLGQVWRFDEAGSVIKLVRLSQKDSGLPTGCQTSLQSALGSGPDRLGQARSLNESG